MLLFFKETTMNYMYVISRLLLIRQVHLVQPIKFKIHLKKSILIPSQHATFYDTYTYKTKIH